MIWKEFKAMLVALTQPAAPVNEQVRDFLDGRPGILQSVLSVVEVRFAIKEFDVDSLDFPADFEGDSDPEASRTQLSEFMGSFSNGVAARSLIDKFLPAALSNLAEKFVGHLKSLDSVCLSMPLESWASGGLATQMFDKLAGGKDNVLSVSKPFMELISQDAVDAAVENSLDTVKGLIATMQLSVSSDALRRVVAVSSRDDQAIRLDALMKEPQGCPPDHMMKYIEALTTAELALVLSAVLASFVGALKCAFPKASPMDPNRLKLFAAVLDDQGVAEHLPRHRVARGRQQVPQEACRLELGHATHPQWLPPTTCDGDEGVSCVPKGG